ncbi:lipase family protein [Mycetocola saprophilus]|uniref:lipase family protein n=1 Tax=Mycetocola saprophilus TaxID=76636 RepID=UPI00068BC41C|nr:lipase family protein [Mycetocola saprophilus]
MRITASRTTLYAGSLALLLAGTLFVPAVGAHAAPGTAPPADPPSGPPAAVAPKPGEASLDARSLAREVDRSFYEVPTPIPATPGRLIRQQPIDAKLYTENLRVPAQAEVIMYSSTSTDGTPTVVTGTVFTPWNAYSGTGERPLVTLAPGTQGLGADCAPSRQFVAGTEYEAFQVTALLLAGYSVVVTDYEGMGTTLDATYLARVSQANAVLDAARAAPQTGLPSISATSPVMLYGYSQGGGASAAAAERAAAYAPELPILGGYAGGVPANLHAVAGYVQERPAGSILLFALTSIGDLAGISADNYLNAAGLEARAWAADNCVSPTSDRYGTTPLRSLTTSGESVTELIDRVPEYSRVIDEQTIGRGTPTFPMLIGQSPADDIIPAGQSADLVSQWCSRGAPITSVQAPAVGHGVAAAMLVPDALWFLHKLVEHHPAPSTCG